MRRMTSAADGVSLDVRAGRVSVDGNPIKLTSHEYRLLSYLMHHAGRVVSRGEIVEHLYDQDFDRDSNTIEVFVARLRKKLGVEIIQTVRGLGYLLAPPEAKDPIRSKGPARPTLRSPERDEDKEAKSGFAPQLAQYEAEAALDRVAAIMT